MRQTFVITVYDESGQLADQCTVHVKLTYENLVAKQKEVTMRLKLRAKNLARKEFEVVGDPVSTAVKCKLRCLQEGSLHFFR